MRLTRGQWSSTILIVLLVFAATVGLRLALYWFSGVAPEALFLAHDGAEYIEFARVIGSAPTAELPAHLIRHDPGYPALLAFLWRATGQLLSLPAIALIIQILSLAGGLVVFANLATRWTEDVETPVDRLPVLLTAFALGYPTAVYYGLFNLSEPLFVLLVLVSLQCYTDKRVALALLVAGLSAPVRSTGLLLGGSLWLVWVVELLAAKSYSWKNLVRAMGIGVLGVGPWIFSQLWVHSMYETNFSVYAPQFGLPFSGYRGLSDAGLIRTLYIFGVTGVFIATAVRLVYLARLVRWQDRLRNTAATFSAIFLTFHLSLKTLYYIDHTVYTFDYQDRYLAPLLPIAVLAWSTYITRPKVALAAGASIAISAWWLKNYVTSAML